MQTLNTDQQLDKLSAPQQKIAIAATFTAEPVEESLTYWMQELGLPSQIEFAPYNQVFQELLAPSSLLSQNVKGINVVLVRFEDWQRFENHESSEDIDGRENLPQGTQQSENAPEKIAQNLEDLVTALKSVAASSATPHLVCLCPAAPSAVADPNQMAFFEQMEELMVSELSGVGGVYLITGADLAAYPVEDYYDLQGDKLGHIPFTPVFFTALGTAIARKIYCLKNAPHKVIVLDCDNTLWKGIVGEDGVTGIEISGHWQALQELMVAQQNAGMIICLCSKNNEPDVVEVFEKRPEMPLKRDHIVTWRINWLPKSENIKSLAKELNLGLDSFIFIDDNPVECAEVQTSCPEVLTIQLPIEEDFIQFLNHIWAFDRLKVTEEDQQRTALYKQNVERDRFQKEALTIEDFLAGLGLKVDIKEVAPSQVARVSQLTQRTNQFNFTTIRRSESEIQQLSVSGLECRVVEVSDRFGDYGLVGVVIFTNAADAINIDTFLLSCRVLGRGVEHRMLAYLAEIAKERGLSRVDASYIPTKKNQPALDFLERVGADFKQSFEQGYHYFFPVEFAAALSYKPQEAKSIPESDALSLKAASANGVATPKTDKSARLKRIASELYDPEQILQRIERQQRQLQTLRATALQQSVTAPRTETEKVLADIWAKVLRFEQVSIQDNFFDLGGTSLLAVRLFAQIEDVFGKELPLSTLLTAPTIEQLASVLGAEGLSEPIKTVVPLQSSGSKPPLFCIYGILLYYDLARNLGTERPVYGVYLQEEVDLLKAGKLGEEQTVLTSVAEQAVLYIKEIRKIQPSGPYFLAGESFGGLVAYEMAQQLLRQGEKVGLVALFDTDGPGGLKKKPLLERVFLHMQKFLQAGPTYALEKVGQTIKSKFVNIISRMYGQLNSSGNSLPTNLQEVATRDIRQQVRDQAISSYVAQPYQEKLVLFRAMTRSEFEADSSDTQWGWGSLATGGLEVHHVPGDHLGILQEPNVKVLADKLKAGLDNAQID